MLVTGVMLALVVVMPSDHARQPWSLREKFTHHFQVPAKWCVALDIEGDGIEEYVVDDQESSNLVYGQNDSTLMTVHAEFATERWFLGGRDLDSDSVEDLLFFYGTDSDTSLIRAQMSGRVEILFPVLPFRDIEPPKGWLRSVYKGVFLDVNGDGNGDLLIPISNSLVRPRGLFALDLVTGDILWEYAMGPAPWKILLSDLDSDGQQEIIALTYAPCNGGKENGIDDCGSTIFVLNREGKLLYQRQIGTFQTLANAVVADLDSDGKNEIIVCAEGGSPLDATSKPIYLLESETGRVRDSCVVKTKFQGLGVLDVGSDGREDILVGTQEPLLLRFDADLNLIQEKTFDESPVELLETLDLDGDGRTEVLISSGQRRLVILDDKLSVLLSEDIGSRFRVFALRNGRSHRLLASVGSTLTLYDIRRNIPILTSPVFAIALAGFLICIAVVVLVFRTRSFALTKLVSRVPFPVLIVERNGVIRPCNEPAFSVFRERDLSGVRFASKEFRLQAHRFSLLGRKLIALEGTSELSSDERTLAWTGMAQRLAHDFKNPLSILVLATQRLKPLVEGARGDRYIKTIMEELQRLRRWVDGFMRFLSLEGPEFASTDIGGLLSKLENRFAQSLPEDVSLDLDVCQDIPPISADQALLEDALGNIIDNALSAVGSEGNVTVRASKEERIAPGTAAEAIEEIEIEIADDGPGISEEDQKKLFTPYFTQKPSGTGLGLVITKRVVEDHHGRIRIDSKPGIGTRVVITLPISQETGDV